MVLLLCVVCCCLGVSSVCHCLLVLQLFRHNGNRPGPKPELPGITLSLGRDGTVDLSGLRDCLIGDCNANRLVIYMSTQAAEIMVLEHATARLAFTFGEEGSSDIILYSVYLFYIVWWTRLSNQFANLTKLVCRKDFLLFDINRVKYVQGEILRPCIHQ